MMKEKLTYSMSERVFEILCALLAAGTTVGYVMMTAAGKGSSVILLVVSLIIYAALTLCSFFPQHTNIAYEPEKCTERNLRLIRRGCIAAKIILITLLFITTAFAAG
ncbi:MAG: hypothetical protein K2G32_04830 [Oscillospiraceae bacterium]|nr:hypothetical protein [Oscillospiraceae bacterium]